MGVLKGYSAGMVIFSLAESDFLQAEAVVRGGLGVNGEASDHFYAGIEASTNIYLPKMMVVMALLVI